MDPTRGTLQVMDGFDLGYRSDGLLHGASEIDAKLIAGPIGDALAVHEVRRAEPGGHGYPSPGVLTASIDSGIAVKSVWDVISGQVFDFAVQARQPDQERRRTSGQVDRARQRRLEGDRRPDARRARHRPEVGEVRRGRLVVDAGGRDRQGRRRADVGRAPRAARRAGAEAQAPARVDLVQAPVERVLRPCVRPRATRRRGRPLHAVPAGDHDGARVQRRRTRAPPRRSRTPRGRTCRSH